ncbi:MAG TPA: FkbM family methyltransferase [bacterium]|nr:FkbM family methyltransferase [bacterium]HOL49137.1 FkbM family methyltransferase [bacterium]HPO51808.1 FkbM family methyltransferase [bacterium]HXK44626.1 FkbM family methyltransferase [bacterium]
MTFTDGRRRAERFVKQMCGKDVWTWRQLKIQTITAGKEQYVICPDFLTSRSIVYSAGIGDDISFDLDIIKNFGAHVFGFDPSPVSIAWIEKYNLPLEFRFFPYGISDHDGEMLMFPPENPNSTSFPLARKTSVEPFEVCVMRLATIMKELGHVRIDLLKLDIEGGEYAVIADMVESDIRPGQVVVEFHHRFPQIGISKTKTALRQLKQAGYKIVHIESRGYVYSFVHRHLLSLKKEGVLVVKPEI